MDNLKFVTNNCNGLATSDEKRLKIFLYLQNHIKQNGVLFLQETHSNSDSEKNSKKISVRTMSFISVMALPHHAV